LVMEMVALAWQDARLHRSALPDLASACIVDRNRAKTSSPWLLAMDLRTRCGRGAGIQWSGDDDLCGLRGAAGPYEAPMLTPPAERVLVRNRLNSGTRTQQAEFSGRFAEFQSQAT